jgi:hypothetical protein
MVYVGMQLIRDSYGRPKWEADFITQEESDKSNKNFEEFKLTYKPRPEILKNNWGEWETPDGFSILFKKHGAEVLIRETDTRNIVTPKHAKALPGAKKMRLVDDIDEAYFRQFEKARVDDLIAAQGGF